MSSSRPTTTESIHSERRRYCEHQVETGVITRHTMDVLMDYTHKFYSFKDRKAVNDAYAAAKYDQANALAKGLQRGGYQFDSSRRGSIFESDWGH